MSEQDFENGFAEDACESAMAGRFRIAEGNRMAMRSVPRGEDCDDDCALFNRVCRCND